MKAKPYHTDHLGSIRIVTDESGAVVDEADYDAYAGPTKRVLTTPFGFGGHWTLRPLDVDAVSSLKATSEIARNNPWPED